MTQVRICSYERHTRDTAILVIWSAIPAKNEHEMDYERTIEEPSRAKILAAVRASFPGASIVDGGHYDLHGNRRGGMR